MKQSTPRLAPKYCLTKILTISMGVLLMLGFVLSPAGNARGASVTDLQKQKQDLQNQINQNQQLAQQKQAEAGRLAGQITGIEGDISATEQKISQTMDEVDTVNGNITSTESQIKTKEQELTVHNKNLNKTLVELYRATNRETYRSTLLMLLSSNDLASVTEGGTQLTILQEQIDKTIKEVQKIKTDLEKEKADLAGQKSTLDGLLSQQQSQDRALLAQRNYKESLKQGAEQAAEDAIAATKKAEKQIGSVDDAIRRALAATGNKSVGYLTGRSVGAGTVIGYMGSTGNSTGPHLHLEVRQRGGYGGSGDINDFLNIGYYNTSNPASNCAIGMNGNSLNLNFGLAKPMNNPRYVTACWGYGGYGDSGYHGGVDMVEYNGAPIMASKGGTVVFHGGLGGWGNAVVIYHGGGLWTLYGHML